MYSFHHLRSPMNKWLQVTVFEYVMTFISTAFASTLLSAEIAIYLLTCLNFEAEVILN